MQEPGRHRGDSWGPREIIAIVVIVLSFGLALAAEITDHPGASVPAWVVALVAGIGLYYYGKNGS